MLVLPQVALIALLATAAPQVVAPYEEVLSCHARLLALHAFANDQLEAAQAENDEALFDDWAGELDRLEEQGGEARDALGAVAATRQRSLTQAIDEAAEIGRGRLDRLREAPSASAARLEYRALATDWDDCRFATGLNRRPAS